MNLRKNDVNVYKFASFFLTKSRNLCSVTEFHNFLFTILLDCGIILLDYTKKGKGFYEL